MSITLVTDTLSHLTMDQLTEHVDLIEVELDDAREASDTAAHAEDPDAWDDAEILIEDLEVRLDALHDEINRRNQVTR